MEMVKRVKSERRIWLEIYKADNTMRTDDGNS